MFRQPTKNPSPGRTPERGFVVSGGNCISPLWGNRHETTNAIYLRAARANLGHICTNWCNKNCGQPRHGISLTGIGRIDRPTLE